MARPCVAILDDWDRISDRATAVERLRNFADVRIFHESLSPESAAEELRGCDTLIAIRERTRFGGELLQALPDLRHIAQTGGGVAHIDLKAATARGIAVSVTPGGSAPAVAELALGLMLGLAHRIAEGDRAVQNGRWPALLGAELLGNTLGIIGLGGIGREVARRAAAFGMNLIAWSPRLTPEMAAREGATAAASLDQLLGRSDYITVHIRLNDQTRGLLSYDRLKLVRRGAVLINTSRGAILPEPDLVRALDEGILGGAGLDVFDREPLPAANPLRNRANVVLTPHVGWTTRQTYVRFFDGAVQNVKAYADGAPANLLNPDVLKPSV